MAKRNLTGRQLAWLFANGILSRSGDGGKKGGGGVTYNKDRAKQVHAARGSTGRRVPSKAERDATRAERVAAGLAQRDAVVKASELERFKAAGAGRAARTAHYEALADKRRREAAPHLASSGFGRAGQPIANARDASRLARLQSQTSRAVQNQSKAEYWDEKAQHTRTAGLKQLRGRVQDRVQKQRLERASVGDTVRYLGEQYIVQKKNKGKVTLLSPRGGIFHISTKI